MQKLNSLQIIRAVTALWIVLYHVSISVDQHGMMDWGISWAAWGSLRVPTFFMLSGFLNVYVLTHKNYSIHEFFTKKFVRLYPVYYLLLPPALIGCVFATTSIICGNTDYIASLLLLPKEVGGAYALPVTWSLQYEVLFYLILGLGIFSFKKDFSIVLIGFAVVVCVVQINIFIDAKSYVITDKYTLALTSHYWLYFLYGAFFSRYHIKKDCFYLGLSVFVLSILPLTDQMSIPSFITIIATSLLLSKLEAAQARFSKFCSNRKFLLYIAKISYSLYLSHILVLGALKRLWAKGGTYGNEWQIIWILSMIVGSILFAALFHELIEKRVVSFLNRKLIKSN